MLVAWGALCLLGALTAGGFAWYQVGPGNRTKENTATVRDVRFVLNHCELGEARSEKVLHSYVSPRSFTGDHLDAYAIKITHLEPGEPGRIGDMGWYRGDQLPKNVEDALVFAGGLLHRVAWFPTNLRSEEYYVYSWSTYFHGTRVGAAQLIFLRPADNMVFYFSGKT